MAILNWRWSMIKQSITILIWSWEPGCGCWAMCQSIFIWWVLWLPATKTFTSKFLRRQLWDAKWRRLGDRLLCLGKRVFCKAASCLCFLFCSFALVNFSDLADELSEYKLHFLEFFQFFKMFIWSDRVSIFVLLLESLRGTYLSLASYSCSFLVVMLAYYVLHLLKQHHPLAEIGQMETEVYALICKAICVFSAGKILTLELFKLRSW